MYNAALDNPTGALPYTALLDHDLQIASSTMAKSRANSWKPRCSRWKNLHDALSKTQLLSQTSSIWRATGRIIWQKLDSILPICENPPQYWRRAYQSRQ